MFTPVDYQITDEAYEPNRGLELGLRKFDYESTGTMKEDLIVRGDSSVKFSNRRYEISFAGDTVDVIETISPVGMLLSVEGDSGLAATTLLSFANSFGQPTEVRSDRPKSFDSDHEFPADIMAEWCPPEVLDADFLEMKEESSDEDFFSKPLSPSTIEEAASRYLIEGLH